MNSLRKAALYSYGGMIGLSGIAGGIMGYAECNKRFNKMPFIHLNEKLRRYEPLVNVCIATTCMSAHVILMSSTYMAITATFPLSVPLLLMAREVH